MIIGLNGRAGSGKDTVAQIIIALSEDRHVQRIAFADKLKQSAAALLGISMEFLELLKTSDTRLNLDPDPELEPEIYNEALNVEMTVRGLLQRYGTEAHREVFSDSFWIEQALVDVADAPDKLYVVTDMRFPNEVRAIEARDGFTVKVKRSESDQKIDSHASEQYIPDEDFDYILNNDGSLDETRLEVIRMLEFFYEVQTCHL